MPAATQIKRGQAILVDGELFKILTLQHVTPGKGNAVVQTELRNLKTGVKFDKRFRSAENVEIAYLETRNLQYLYESGGQLTFMDQESYEQFEIPHDLLGDGVNFLAPDTNYTADFYEGRPVGVTLPSNVVLKVTETAPPQKGDAGKTKVATLENGYALQVPLFIDVGEAILVSTDTGRYLERA